MKNYVQPGHQLTVTAPYNVSGGEGVLVGQLFGIAFGDALSTESVDIETVGVFDIAKDADNVFTVGAPVYFDTTTKTARSGNDDDSNSIGEAEACIGVAVAAAGAGEATVRVRLGTPVTLV